MKKSDLDRLENKIDNLVERTSNIDVTIAKQSVILDEHVKRTNILQSKVEPIEKSFVVVKGILKIIGFMGLGALLKIIHTLMTT